MSLTSGRHRRQVFGEDLGRLADERLLELFHTEHREDCFAELVQRYMDIAFRVAFARCGRQELAEEAVQEAFFRLSRAPSGPPIKDSTPFKLRLIGSVSSSALNCLRSERRKAERIRGQPSRIEALALPADGEVRRETREALIRALGGLEEEIRLPIMLHFLEGLTQAQIGALAGVAQSVVARRIAVGLAALRSRLSRAGIDARALSLPGLLQTEGLLQATPALRQALASTYGLASHASAPPPVVGKPHPLAAAKGFPLLLIGLGTGGLVAAVLVLVAAGQSPPSARATVTASVAAGPAAQAGLCRTWDFRLDPGKDLTVVSGDWRWVRGEGLQTVSPAGVCALLPLELSELPLRAEITYGFSNIRFHAVADIVQTDGAFTVPFTAWPGKIVATTGKPLVVVVYLAPKKDVRLFNNTMVGLREYTTSLPRNRLCLFLRNCIVSRVTLQTIDRREMPVSDEEMESYKKRCAPVKSQGTLKS